jgi:hypothetical protein
MQMIDVMKRLAELDAANPNVQQSKPATISESAPVEECGMMGMPESAPQAHSPASIHITANDGEELSGMLKDIMQLAGMNSSTSDDSEVLSTEPVVSVPDIDSTPADSMRAVIDKLHSDDDGLDISGDDEEETEECYDNSPEDSSDIPAYDSEKLAYHPNSPGAAKGRGLQNHPIAVPTMEQMEQQLYADYQNFVVESVDNEMDETRGFRGVGGRRDREDDEHWGSGYKKPVGKWTPAVFIDGKKWKTFSDKAEAQRVAAAVSKKYPDKHVSVQDTYVSESSVEEGYEDNKAAAAKAPSAAERAKSRDAQHSSAARKARNAAEKKRTWQDKDGTYYVGKPPKK